jgi:hypothetical protein
MSGRSGRAIFPGESAGGSLKRVGRRAYAFEGADSLGSCSGSKVAMMGERRVQQEALFYEFSLERHVPETHLPRHIDRFVELDGLRRELVPFYSEMGRPETSRSPVMGRTAGSDPIPVNCRSQRREKRQWLSPKLRADMRRTLRGELSASPRRAPRCSIRSRWNRAEQFRTVRFPKNHEHVRRFAI